MILNMNVKVVVALNRESEVVASTSRSKVRPRSRVTAERGGTKKSQPTAESSTST